MTLEQFKSTAIALLRSAIGWQTKIAERLEIEPRTVRRWLEAGTIPPWAAQKLAELTGMTDQAPWPRDEWIVGDTVGHDGNRREYVFHMQPPRFVARVVACDDEGIIESGELPADVVSGSVYTSDGFCLCEIAWIDQPRAGELVQILEAAANAVDAA